MGASRLRRDPRMGARATARACSPSRWRRSSAASRIVPLVGTEFVPAAGPGLHLAAPQHAGGLEPRVHGQQGAPGRGGAARRFRRSTLAMTTVGTDEGRNYARIHLKLADREQARALAERHREGDPQTRCADPRHRAHASASTGRSSSTSWGRIRRRSRAVERAHGAGRQGPRHRGPRASEKPANPALSVRINNDARPTSASPCSRSARRCGR